MALNRSYLADKLKELEARLDKHDKEIAIILDGIHKLMRKPEKPKRQIGFHTD